MDSIICRFLKGTATSSESEKLLNWLKESKENLRYYFAAKRAWLEEKTPEEEKFPDDSWNRLKLRTVVSEEDGANKDRSWGITFKKLSVAASVLILLGISSFLGIKLKEVYEFDQTVHEISVPKGARTSLTLPDGTNVWLNSGTTLKYKSDFGRKNRNINLSGEAFFDVRQQDNSAFTVNTRDMDIRVLGTRINVKSYPEDNMTETTLITGKAELLIADRQKDYSPVSLSPNQKVTYSRDTDTLFYQQIEDAEECSAWKDGRLRFRSETLKNIARDLERFYNVEILFTDENIKETRFTGTLEEVTIEGVLQAIGRVSPIRYEIEKNRVYISEGQE